MDEELGRELVSHHVSPCSLALCLGPTHNQQCASHKVGSVVLERIRIHSTDGVLIVQLIGKALDPRPLMKDKTHSSGELCQIL